MLWGKLQRLKSRDPKTRARVVQDMAVSGDPSTVEPIAEALKDEEPEVRLAAARALGVLQNERSLGPLIVALKDRRADVRAAAVTSLRQLGDTRAIDALTGSLEDNDHSVRWQAAAALKALGWRPGSNTEFILRSVAMAQHEDVAIHGTRAVEVLARALSDPTCPRRHAAAQALEIGRAHV